MKRLLNFLILAGAVGLALWFVLSEGGSEPADVDLDPLGADDGAAFDSGVGSDLEPDLPSDGDDLLDGGTGTVASRDRARSALLRGRVVDDRRRPVADVQVTLQWGQRRPLRAQTDAEGSYRFEFPGGSGAGRTRGGLMARAADGRLAMGPVWLPAGMREMVAPTLVLVESAELLVRVVREGVREAGAQVVAMQRHVGVPAIVASRTTDAQGEARLTGLPPGILEVYAASAGSGRTRAETRVPRADGSAIEIALAGERRIDVEVVDARSDQPIAGAEVLPGNTQTMPIPHGPGYVPLWTSVRTNRSGRVTLTGLNADEVAYINARAPGYALAPWWMQGGRGVPVGQGTHRIALARERVVSFPVSEAGVGPPPDGVVLVAELNGAGALGSGALSARMDAGTLVVRGLPARPVTGVVRTPEGAQAVFHAPAGVDMGGVVTFRGARQVRVRLLDAEGGPQPDVAIRLDALGQGARIEPRRTDAEGLATFDGVGGDAVAVYLVVADQPSSGLLLGKLDLKQEKDVYEVELQRRVRLTLEIRVQDEARLPGQYTLMVGDRRVSGVDIEEDPGRGTLLAWVRPPPSATSLSVGLHADGYQTASTTLEFDGQEVFGALELKPAGSLHVEVKAPADEVFSVRLEMYDTGPGDWVAARPQGAGFATSQLVGPQGRSTGGEQIFKGLLPGRYRVVDARSGIHSAEVAVVPSEAAPRVTLDLSTSAWIEGRVVGPAGADLSQAQVLVEGRDDPGNIWAGIRADAKGQFRLRGRRGQKLALVVRHPTLRAAAKGGRILVDAAAGPVEIKLEAGATAQFRLSGYEQVHSQGGGAWLSPVRLQLASTSGESTYSIQPTASGGVFTFGGYHAGSYRLTLVFNTKHAPLVMPSVALGEGLTDLGTLTPTAGTTLVVRIQGSRPEGSSLWATATHLGEPSYARQAALDQRTGELRCTGLGPGRFRILVRGANLAPGSTMASALYDEEVRVSGSGEFVVDVNLR